MFSSGTPACSFVEVNGATQLYTAQRVLQLPRVDVSLPLFVLVLTISFTRYNSQEKHLLVSEGGSDALSAVVQTAFRFVSCGHFMYQ